MRGGLGLARSGDANAPNFIALVHAGRNRGPSRNLTPVGTLAPVATSPRSEPWPRSEPHPRASEPSPDLNRGGSRPPWLVSAHDLLIPRRGVDPVEHPEFGFAEPQRAGSDVLLEVLEAAGAGNRQDVLAAVQGPRQ